jgi:hypothetical protein
MGVGTAAAGSLCVGKADFVPAFILKKRFTHYVRLNVRIHYISLHLLKNNTFAKSAPSFPLTIFSIPVALVVSSEG